MLVERDEHIGRLTSFISEVVSGTPSGPGRTAVISGPVASGKTALLHRVLEETGDRGPRLLSALASPAEQSIPFGVVEQLLRAAPQPEDRPGREAQAGQEGPAVRPGPAAYRAAAEPASGDLPGVFQDRLAALRARGPVLIAVDDAQYADPQSLRCLAQALRRFPAPGTAALSLVVTRGPDAGAEPPRGLEELLHQAGGLHLRLSPLTVEGVGRLLMERAGDGSAEGAAEDVADRDVPDGSRPASDGSRPVPDGSGRVPDGTRPASDSSRAVSLHAATGGNPLLVRALLEDDLARLRQPAAERETGSHLAAADPLALPDRGSGPGGGESDGGAPRAGERFLHSALICVHRAGADGPKVAQGIALLGSAGSLSLLARLMEIEEPAVRRVVTALGEAGVLAGTRFRHDGVRTAVVESLSDDAVARLRRRAARLLYEDGAAPLLVAGQLLGHESAAPHEPWVPEVLTEAAHAALATQRTAFAVRCLRTAESCCRDEADRVRIRAILAGFLCRVKPSAWAQQLRSLTGAMRTGQLPPADTLRLVGDLLWNGWVDDAATAIRQVAEVLPDSPDAAVARELRRLWLILSGTYPAVLEGMGGFPAPGGGARRAPDEGALAGTAALYGVLSGGDGAGERSTVDAEFIESVERLLAGTRVTDGTVVGMWAGLLSLMYADRLDRATRWADRLVAEATEQEAPGWTAVLVVTRAHVSLRRGRLAEARRLAERSLEHLPPHGWGVAIGMPLAALVEARTAMGDHEAAAELVDRPVPEAMFMTRYGLHYRYARGRHQLATGRPYAALTDFMACGELMRRWNMDRSSLVPWRVGVAESWLALGDRSRAERFAREQLAADAGPRVRGMASRVLAAAGPLEERPALLGEAVSLLQEEGDWYGLARALTDLGQAYKELGEGAQSKLHTRRAWRIAEGCGARELCRPRQQGSSASPARTGGVSRSGPSRADVRERSGPASTLTDAERKVAALAAQGYTNREISARLFITISTVEQHLTRVYRKINITHRQDLPVSLDTDVAHTA
ncbi:AAA family ATPase [Streptomyces sp. NPDC014894]|uniref:helix-turn-helix transcriptional regulator n=1 Tax=Streptomyces sp. NPDC014894 TaxID=3364931 RepID=UPI0036F8B731